ncbi:MAG: DUF4367 domain-containing protein, partial [Defluviitaleaceae bacterium]|nr:DUF4367 domain-containing protein [Defluviitaleaceae bacterium]
MDNKDFIEKIKQIDFSAQAANKEARLSQLKIKAEEAEVIKPKLYVNGEPYHKQEEAPENKWRKFGNAIAGFLVIAALSVGGYFGWQFIDNIRPQDQEHQVATNGYFTTSNGTEGRYDDLMEALMNFPVTTIRLPTYIPERFVFYSAVVDSFGSTSPFPNTLYSLTITYKYGDAFLYIEILAPVEHLNIGGDVEDLEINGLPAFIGIEGNVIIFNMDDIQYSISTRIDGATREEIIRIAESIVYRPYGLPEGFHVVRSTNYPDGTPAEFPASGTRDLEMGMSFFPVPDTPLPTYGNIHFTQFSEVILHVCP